MIMSGTVLKIRFAARKLAWRYARSPSEDHGLGHGLYAYSWGSQRCACGHQHGLDEICWHCWRAARDRAYGRLGKLK